MGAEIMTISLTDSNQARPVSAGKGKLHLSRSNDYLSPPKWRDSGASKIIALAAKERKFSLPGGNGPLPRRSSLRWLWGGFAVALRGWPSSFCILHSTFCIHSWVALGSQSPGYQVALGWLCCRITCPDPAFLHSALCIRLRVSLPGHSSFFILHSAFAFGPFLLTGRQSRRSLTGDSP
jgi:hypothetical protein